MVNPQKDLRDLERLIDQELDQVESSLAFTPKEFAYYRQNPDVFLEKELAIGLFDNTFTNLSEKQMKIMNQYSEQYNLPIHVPITHRDFVRSFADLSHLYDIVGGARGASKTYLLSGLVVWASIFLPPDFNGAYFTNIVAGTREQADEMNKRGIKQHLKRPRIAFYLTDKPLKSLCQFSTGGEVEVLTGSEKSVRHGHPHWLVIDEGAELDKKEGASVTYAALEQISGSPHGRVSMTSTMHYLGGAFGDFWENYQKKGYRRAQWDMLPGHRPWIPFEKQVQEFEQMKLHSANFAVAALARPELSVELEFPMELIRSCRMNSETYTYYKQLVKDKSYQEAWLSFDWGYSPHLTVLTVFVKFDNNVICIWKQEAYSKPSVEKILDKATYYSTEFNTPRIYGDSRGGQHHMDSLRKIGFKVYPVDFGKEDHKNTLAMRLLQLMQTNTLLISPSCQTLLKVLEKVHRNEKGKFVEFVGDDHVDSVFAGMEPVSRRNPARYLMPPSIRKKMEAEKAKKSDETFFQWQIRKALGNAS